MSVLTTLRLHELQSNANNIRNICIVAHVDHGKTTLADNLVASNGIISQKLAGQLRYMDSRKDEQERGITMKSSSISLSHTFKEQEYLVNLVDTPGHVDFTSEVSTAVRICDGALVVVDVVEGVAPQTKAVLKQVWNEGIKPILVVNKIDRLISELKMTPGDAYKRIVRVIEQVNAVIGELFSSEIMEKAEKNVHTDEDIDDSEVYFIPSVGNVVLASAYDGWGFTLSDFALLYAKKLGVSYKDLLEKLWGDFYYSAKSKCIMDQAEQLGRKPLFVQLVLENLYSVYNAFLKKDKNIIEKITSMTKVHIKPQELNRSDSKMLIQSFMSKWLPMGGCILDCVCDLVPSPCGLSDKRVERLLSKFDKPFSSLPPETQALKPFFVSCDSKEGTPVIIFISKMISVPGQYVTRINRQTLTAEEMDRKHREAKDKYLQKMERLKLGEEEVDTGEAISEDHNTRSSQEIMIAVGRIFSGTVTEGDELYILGPKYDPELGLKDKRQEVEVGDIFSQKAITRSRIGKIYALMGREMESIGKVYPGNIIGIGGLQDTIIKSATISDSLACPAFTELIGSSMPILQTAIQPKELTHMSQFVKGLKLLNQADPCARVYIDDSGEYILSTAGEIHLQKCINDLEEHYAGIKVLCSDPIVPFRETVVADDLKKGAYAKPEYLVEGSVVGCHCSVKIRAAPLPGTVVGILDENSELIRVASDVLNAKISGANKNRDDIRNGTDIFTNLNRLKGKLEIAFKESGCTFWENAVNEIWSFGPRNCGPNILLNRTRNFRNASFWGDYAEESENFDLKRYGYSFVSGFQYATAAGPLCEEPLHGVCFIVEEWIADTERDVVSGVFLSGGQVMSMVKDTCRRAMQARSPRLVLPMYQCDVFVNADVLGRVYAVIGRRHGRVLLEDIQEGSTTFLVRSAIPVIESFHFASEIRTEASGLAIPQLIFSHWETLDLDPFWDPLENVEEEDEDIEITVNRAQAYINQVRRRKGLPVRERIVAHAEKQRTLSKNK